MRFYMIKLADAWRVLVMARITFTHAVRVMKQVFVHQHFRALKARFSTLRAAVLHHRRKLALKHRATTQMVRCIHRVAVEQLANAFEAWGDHVVKKSVLDSVPLGPFVLFKCRVRWHMAIYSYGSGDLVSCNTIRYDRYDAIR